MVASAARLRVSWKEERTWPTQAEAARLLAMTPSALSKQARKGRVACTYRGIGKKKSCLVSPGEVLRLALDTGRVPVSQVKEELARSVARRFRVDPGVLLRELDCLEESRGAVTGLTQGAIAMESTQSSSVAVPRTKAREINLGRIRPLVIRESEATLASMGTAQDETRRRELPFKPGERKAREVNLGKMRPGFRF